MPLRFLRRHRMVILYGAGLALLLILLKWLEWRFLIFNHAIEVYSGAIAVLFTGLGIWLAVKLAKPKVVTVTLPAPETTNAAPGANPAADPANPGAAPSPSPFAANASTSSVISPAAITPDPAAAAAVIAKLGLSTRELEVLNLMAEGLSNQEIAGRLFVSLNTIKTHSSRIFEKLDVRRRTQAVEMARRLRILHSKA